MAVSPYHCQTMTASRIVAPQPATVGLAHGLCHRFLPIHSSCFGTWSLPQITAAALEHHLYGCVNMSKICLSSLYLFNTQAHPCIAWRPTRRGRCNACQCLPCCRYCHLWRRSPAAPAAAAGPAATAAATPLPRLAPAAPTPSLLPVFLIDVILPIIWLRFWRCSHWWPARGAIAAVAGPCCCCCLLRCTRARCCGARCSRSGGCDGCCCCRRQWCCRPAVAAAACHGPAGRAAAAVIARAG